MPDIIETELPGSALIQTHKQQGALTDCFNVEIAGHVSLADFIEAFYTSSVFTIEGVLISVFTLKRVKQRDAVALAEEASDDYALWTVEERRADQILMRERTGRTLSWLMVCPVVNNGEQATRLSFGSVVLPIRRLANGESEFGRIFDLLGGFHRVYSRALLKAAYHKILKNKKRK